VAEEGTQPTPRSSEEIARDIEELLRTFPTLKGKELREAMVKLQSLTREKMRVEAGPALVEYEQLLKEIAEKSARAAELRKGLEEAGAIEAEAPERKVRRAYEGPLMLKFSTSPLGRYIAAKVKEAGTISEAQLREAISPYKWSGSTSEALRGLRDQWHLIDFPGSPGTPEKVAAISYVWVATPEALASYNEAITKKGLEGF
jgi:hypothetical protein